jgi:spore coat protein H
VYLHPTTNKLMFLPWDQDFSFGNNRRGGNDAATIYFPWSDNNLFLGRMYAQNAFRLAYLNYMDEFSKTLFLPERFAAQIAEIAPVIRPAVQQEGTQWLAGFDQVASGQAGILPFVRARAASVIRQLQTR